jgi:cell division protein FtsL
MLNEVSSTVSVVATTLLAIVMSGEPLVATPHKTRQLAAAVVEFW